MAFINARHGMLYRIEPLGRRWWAALLVLVACVATYRAVSGLGIGDPEQAKGKVRKGMTRGEVRSALGPPHGRHDERQGAIYWTYRCDAFGRTLFRVNFGPDDRVTTTEWWLD